MSKSTWYYRENCPICGEDGEMVICKTPTGHWCFRCAECFLAFDDPNDMHLADRGYSAVDVPMTAPTREEIEQHGWGEHCIHEIVE